MPKAIEVAKALADKPELLSEVAKPLTREEAEHFARLLAAEKTPRRGWRTSLGLFSGN